MSKKPVTHTCPRTDKQWMEIIVTSGVGWAMADWEYGPQPIVACPYCGVRLTAPAASSSGVSTEGAAWAMEASA